MTKQELDAAWVLDNWSVCSVKKAVTLATLFAGDARLTQDSSLSDWSLELFFRPTQALG